MKRILVAGLSALLAGWPAGGRAVGAPGGATSPARLPASTGRHRPPTPITPVAVRLNRLPRPFHRHRTDHRIIGGTDPPLARTARSRSNPSP